MDRRKFLKATSITLFSLMCPTVFAKQKNQFNILLNEVLKDTTLYRTLLPTNGQLQYGRGESLQIRNDLLSHSQQQRLVKSLLFFGQITDIHINDEESPGRLVAADPILESLIGVGNFFRPQEDLLLRSTDSMIRTFNNISQKTPLDFLINTGDSIDSAHKMELTNIVLALNGGYIDPDSGKNEDPRPGPNNDGNDPFTAPGFRANLPIYTAIGNHDILHQGFIPPSLRKVYNSVVEKYLDFMTIHDPVGDHSNAILTPWSTPPDPAKLKPGKIVPDQRRSSIAGKDLIDGYVQNKHARPILGFPQSLLGSEFGYYSTKPKSDLPIRLIVLDTACRYGSPFGVIDSVQFEEFLIPELEKAKQQKELVIIASHHPAESIMTLAEVRENSVSRFNRDKKWQKMATELVSHIQDTRNYISKNQLVETFKSYPNVFLHLAGHRHTHKITPYGKGLNGYWEVQNCSLVEFPQQGRLFEIVYEGDGIGAIHTATVDHNSSKDSLASLCRELAYKDEHGKNRISLNKGKLTDRNSALRFEIPKEIAKKL